MTTKTDQRLQAVLRELADIFLDPELTDESRRLTREALKGVDRVIEAVRRDARLAKIDDRCPICGGDHDRITRADCPTWEAQRLAFGLAED